MSGSSEKTILIVDDDLEMRAMLADDLKRRGWLCETAEDGGAALKALQEQDADLVLTDMNMPGMGGLALCEKLADNRPDLPVIVLTAFGSLDTAVGAIRAGAYDFVTKPVDTDLLAIALDRAWRHRQMQRQIQTLQAAAGGEDEGELMGRSGAMRELRQQITRIAATDASVMVHGESGTGKELVARMLHERSERRSRPFVAVNCAALPGDLLESELFGHRKGAFTDAHTDRRGLLLEASGGTLLLDEIGEMPLTLQPKLLRALEERRLRPVGGSTEVPFDVRIVSATNRDLEAEIESGGFREDLYYRLNVIQLEVPALRSRGTDVLQLAEHFLALYGRRFGKDMKGLAGPTAERLLNYNWPGNVRELRNAMERAVALTRFDHLGVDDLPRKVKDHQATRLVVEGDDPSELVPMEEMERRYILHVLKASEGNRTMAARILGLDRKTLYRKLQRYGVDGD